MPLILGRVLAHISSRKPFDAREGASCAKNPRLCAGEQSDRWPHPALNRVFRGWWASQSPTIAARSVVMP